MFLSLKKTYEELEAERRQRLRRAECSPRVFSAATGRESRSLKRLSHEMDLKKLYENLQNLAYHETRLVFKIFEGLR